MAFQEANGLRFFQFESFASAPVVHGVFTRQGGVSQGPFSQLNVSSSVADEPAAITENVKRLFAAAGRPLDSMFDSWLVHGTDVLVSGAPRPAGWGKPPKADIIMTNKLEVSLFMRYADCVPLLFIDPDKHAVALAHAGWRGTLAGVAAKTVAELIAHYGSNPTELLVGIGPAICAEHYEVGPEVVAEVQAVFGDLAADLLPEFNCKPHFDLVAANRVLLQQAGVTHVEESGQCTFANTEDWFSHRASGGQTGRFGVLLALQ